MSYDGTQTFGACVRADASAQAIGSSRHAAWAYRKHGDDRCAVLRHLLLEPLLALVLWEFDDELGAVAAVGRVELECAMCDVLITAGHLRGDMYGVWYCGRAVL